MVKQFESLSARRAWIEIKTAETAKTSNADVALRKESVDRNKMMYSTRQDLAESLSARRAWIEISLESPIMEHDVSRSPQGERG